MARTRLCNLWSRRQLLVTFLDGQAGFGNSSLLPGSQAAQCLPNTRLSKLSTSSNVLAQQPLASEEASGAGSVQQIAGGRVLPSSSEEDLESIRLRAWSMVSQVSPALSGSILPMAMAAQVYFVRRSGTRASSGQASNPPPQSPQGEELATAKFVRVAAILVIVAIGASMLPRLGQATSDHAVALLENPKPFFQKSGATRIKTLASSETAAKRMLELGVAQKLVDVLSGHPSPEIAKEVVAAMDVIANADQGRHSLHQAGALTILQSALQQQTLASLQEDIKSVAYKLKR